MPFDTLGVFAAGLLTFASPCVLPLAPVYLAVISGASLGELRARTRVLRAVAAATAFAIGLGVVFVLLGMAVTTLGHALVAHRALLMQLGGVAILLAGLKVLGVLQVPWLDRDVRVDLRKTRGTGVGGAFVMGAAFGLGWTPCIGPVLGSVLTFTATTSTSTAEGAGLLAAYAAGLGLPLVVAASIAPLALGWLQRALRWIRPMQLATGALLSVVGLLVLTDSLGAFDPSRWAEQPPVAEGPAACGAEGACELPTETLPSSAMPTVIEAGLPTLVEFVGRTCPVCLRMAPVIAAANRDCAGRRVRVQRVEVDGAAGRELARQHGVLGVPTFLFLDGDGGEVARLVGEQPLAVIEQSLQVLSGESCRAFRVLPPSTETAPTGT